MPERETRPCGSRSDHVPHPHGGPWYWCEGRGRYAATTAPQPVPDGSGELCGYRYVGEVNGSVFVCRAPKGHPTDPTQGYAGSGHNMIGLGKT